MSEISVWQITPTGSFKQEMNASTLDEVTQSLPEGYYSTFRTFEGGTRVLGLALHLRRLYEPVPRAEVDVQFLRGQLTTLFESYRPGEVRVRAVMTKAGNAYLALAPLAPLPHEVYEQGVRVETTELARNDPRLKSTSFIGRSDQERRRLAQKGIFEALLVKEGKILEGMTSNFFYVAGGDAIPPYLGTARTGILLGVTRRNVLRIARGRGFRILYEPVRLDQLATIAESFITSSSRGVVPVVQVNALRIGEGRPGPVTQELMAAYDAYVRERAEKI